MALRKKTRWFVWPDLGLRWLELEQWKLTFDLINLEFVMMRYLVFKVQIYYCKQ